MSGLQNIKGMPGLEPFVALIATIVDEVLAESGVAAQNFATLGDKTTADLPTLNTALAVALASKANNLTALAHYVDAGNPHATTAAQVGAIPVGGLKTINGASIVGTGNIAVSGGAGDIASLTDKATADLPTINAPLAAALTGKVDNLPPVNLGTTGVTLNRTSHGSRLNYFSGSTDQTFPLSTTAAVTGDWMELAHGGTGGVMTFTGLSAAAGKKVTLSVGETGYAEFFSGAWRSGIDAGSSSTALGTISGIYTTGSLLTFTPASGWSGTYQWLRNGANISGATSATYTLVSGDETNTITCKFTPTYYIANGGIASPAADTTPPTVLTATIPSSDSTRVNLVFSEAINSTLGLPAKWVTSGHTYTAITYDTSTTAHLTTSVPFTSGETVSLAYTANGTNDVKDLATTPNLLANFTGKSVTNNVPSGSFTEDFVGTDSTTNPGHNLSWTQHSGVWGKNGNKAYCSSLTDGAAMTTNCGFTAGREVSSIITAENNDYRSVGILLSLVSTTNGIVLLIDQASNRLKLAYFDGSGLTVPHDLSGWSANNVWAVGDVIKGRWNNATGDLTAYVNGTIISSITTNVGAGNSSGNDPKVGLYSATDTVGQRFGSFVANVYP